MSSLATDSIFFTALQQNQQLMQALGFVEATAEFAAVPPRLYGTAIPCPDENLQNTPVPYVIIGFSGLTNKAETKDDLYEGSIDEVMISIEVAGRTNDELETLTQSIRNTIVQYMRTNDTIVIDYDFSAGPISYDWQKPCYWQTLNYRCEVKNTISDEQS